MKLTQTDRKAAALLGVARRQLELGNTEGADRSFDELERLVSTVDNLAERARLYADLATVELRVPIKKKTRKRMKNWLARPPRSCVIIRSHISQ